MWDPSLRPTAVGNHEYEQQIPYNLSAPLTPPPTMSLLSRFSLFCSRKLGKVSPGSSVRHGLVACFLKPGEISVTFTCRVKVEGPSAPYGIANATASTTPGVSFGSGDECSGWHPVLCHRPLTVSVLAENEANAAGLAQAQVCECGGREAGREGNMLL